MSAFIEQARYSCALAAQQTVLAIPRAHPVVHAGPGCSFRISRFTGSGAGHQGEGYTGGSHISSTNSCESEIVFGGERKLRATIEGALRVIKGDLFVVLTGCTAGIVGDDVQSVAGEFLRQGKPVVAVETAGFKGSSYYGHEQVVKAILEQGLGGVRPRPRKGLVNVFSVVPYQDPYWRADLETLKQLLESIGLEPQVLFGYSSAGMAEWKNIPNAQFNLLVSPWVGLSAVRLLEEQYGTPFLHYPVLPSGAIETGAFLRKTAAFAGIPASAVEAVVSREEDRFYQYLGSLVDFLAEFRNNLPAELYVAAGSAYALGISAFMVNEMGYIPKGVYLTDDPPESCRALIRAEAAARDERLGGLLCFENDGGLVQRDIKARLGKSRRALLLGSSWEKLLAQETGNLYAFISLPLPETVILNRSCLGYNGGLQLLEEIYSNIFKTKTATSRTQAVSPGGLCSAGAD
ncbi:MAG: hydrogenase [Treponema sp.]|jgi:nitrogenase molybdenum-iron protein beta chain|nr:hydrogenase [Treponema sp.]